MDFIFDYQYELLYSFGALFAFFSMLSYVAPVVQAIVKGETSMDSSDQFFEGFDGPDLESLMASNFSDEDEDEDEDDETGKIVSLEKKTGGFSHD